MSSKVEKLHQKIIERQKKLAIKIMYQENKQIERIQEEEYNFLEELMNT